MANSNIYDELEKIYQTRVVSVNSMMQWVFYFIKFALRKYFIFVVSSHPIPFYNRHSSVLHDTYPFYNGPYCSFKRILYRLALKSSNSWVVYINRSVSQKYLIDIGVLNDRCLYVPNIIRDSSERQSVNRFQSNIDDESLIVIGLIGTDSDKKNYGELLKAISLSEASSNFQLQFYGHDSLYYREIFQSYHQSVDMILVESNFESIGEFIGKIDVVLSVAKGEGFGRPIANAICSGVPVVLLADPVFIEFYSFYATIVNSIEEAIDVVNEKNWITPSDAKDFELGLDKSFKIGMCSIKEKSIGR